MCGRRSPPGRGARTDRRPIVLGLSFPVCGIDALEPRHPTGDFLSAFLKTVYSVRNRRSRNPSDAMASSGPNRNLPALPGARLNACLQRDRQQPGGDLCAGGDPRRHIRPPRVVHCEASRHIPQFIGPCPAIPTPPRDSWPASTRASCCATLRMRSYWHGGAANFHHEAAQRLCIP